MIKPVITIFEFIHQSGIDELSKFAEVTTAYGATREQHIELSNLSDIIIVKSAVQVDKELLGSSTSLSIVARAGTGVDNIDLPEAERLGVKVLTVPTGNSVSAAEFTILQILLLCRRIPEVIDFTKENNFRRHLLEGRELQNMTVGLVGIGNVGMLVFERLKPFGCKILAYDPYSDQVDNFTFSGGIYCSSFDDLVSRVDIISFHTRLTKENYHMMSDHQFNVAKAGLLLVNNARADLVDQSALLRALESGVVVAAALDVLTPELPFDLEPKDHNYQSPLLENKDAFVTPHIGASTVDAQKRISLDISMQILDVWTIHHE